MPGTTDLKNARLEKPQGTPGESMSVDFGAYGDNVDDGEFFQLPGFVGIPHDGEVGVKVESNGLNIVVGSNNYKIVIAGLEKGEPQIFSYDSDGNILSSAKCNKDGEFVINNGTDFAVLFNELKTQFNELQTAFNTHTHTYAPGPGSPIPSGPSVPQSVANIDTTKAEKIRI